MALCISISYIYKQIPVNLRNIIFTIFIIFILYVIYFIDEDYLYENFYSLNNVFDGSFSIFLRKFDSFYERLHDVRSLYDIDGKLCSDSMSGILQSIVNMAGILGFFIGFAGFIFLTIAYLYKSNINPQKISFVYTVIFIIMFINAYGWITASGFITLSIIYLDSLRNND
jgi:hypothetical protein